MEEEEAEGKQRRKRRMRKDQTDPHPLLVQGRDKGEIIRTEEMTEDRLKTTGGGKDPTGIEASRLLGWPDNLDPSFVGRYGDVVALYPRGGDSDSGRPHKPHASYIGATSDISVDALLDTIRISTNVAKSVLIKDEGREGKPTVFHVVSHSSLP